MNNLLHLFEENPMKKVDKDMFRDYVRAPFPKDDDSWKDMFDIKRYNKMVHIYHNTTGEGLYGVARRDFINDQGAPDKQITQFSYCGNHKKYVNANLWSEEPHLHNEHLMADSKQDTCGVVEGEKAMEAGKKHFPQAFWTTFSGGLQNIDKVDDWGVLNAFKTIVFWSDADNGSRDLFLLLAQQLNDELDAEVKIVDLPRNLPKDTWDLANKRNDDGIDIHNLFNNAVPIDEFVSFNNLERDIKNNRYVFVKSSDDGYHDRLTKEIVREKVLNNLYLRDKNSRGKATKELHTRKCEFVDGYAFVPSEKEIVKVGNETFLNKYRPIKFVPLSEDERENLEEDLSPVLAHIFRLCDKDDFNYKHLLSTIAHDIQYPHINRTWCVLFSSKQRYGKSFLFYLLEKLYGEANCDSGIETDDFIDKYRDWMLSCNSVFCHEFSWNARDKKFFSKMKRLITETKHKVETKYKTKIKFRGSYNIWLASNDPVSIKLGSGDGRYHVIRIEESPKELLAEVNNPNYYKDLFKLLENKDFLNKAYDYFNNYKIDYKIFDRNHVPKTDAKQDLQDAGLEQWMKDLNELREKKLPPFRRNFTCEFWILEELRKKENGRAGYGSMFHGVDEEKIRIYFDEINAKRLNKGIQIALPGDPTRRKMWIIENQHFWVNCTDKRLMRLHMEGKFDPPPLLVHASNEAQKEKSLNGGDYAHSQNRGVG
jgi:hypothetical protein